MERPGIDFSFAILKVPFLINLLLLLAVVAALPLMAQPVQASDTWTEVTPETKPSARFVSGMAYDSESNRVILFGGHVGGPSNGETWAFDPSAGTWTNMAPTGGPSAREWHKMTYWPAMDRVLLFGGSQSGFVNLMNDLWAYDFNTNAWANLAPVGTLPSARQPGGLAIDTQSDRLIMFGGDSGGFQSDTWSYDRTTNAWTLLSPIGTPPARTTTDMVYDAESDLVVLFGGDVGPNVIVGDTWTFDYDLDTWTDVSPVSGPSGRGLHRMAYDAQGDRVVLFGGYNGANLGDTWVFDANGNAWTQKAPLVSPPARAGHAMAYSSTGDQTVLFGGAGGAGLRDDTWVYQDEEEPAEVEIDIKPGSFPNSINPRSSGTIPVAILSGPTLDAPTQVDTSSLTFGHTGNEQSLVFCSPSPEDVNEDGLLDLVCHFDTRTTGFGEDSETGILRGQLLDGTQIEGSDSVRIVRGGGGSRATAT